MMNALRWVWFCGLLIGVGVGLMALYNWVLGKSEPLWVGVLWLVAASVGVGLLNWCERRGWIRGVFWSRPKELEERERERALGAERERIITEAVARQDSAG
jgi:hypothetical protein